MVKIIEHIVYNYLKIAYLCNQNNFGEAIGDLPGGPYCFKNARTLEVDGAMLLWSEWISYENLLIRFSATKVQDKLRTIGFHIRGVGCSESPETLYTKVKALLLKACGENVNP